MAGTAESRGNESLGKDFSTSFKSIYSWIGILVSSIAILNLLRSYSQMSFGRIAEALVESYRAVFHPIAALFLGILPIQLPPFASDLLILWLIAGCAVARTSWIFMQSLSKAPVWRTVTSKGKRSLVTHTANSGSMFADFFLTRQILWPAFLLLSALAWPAILALFMRRPVRVMSDLDLQCVPFSRRNEGEYLYDLRRIFAMQLGAAIAVCSALVLLDQIGPQLG